MTKIKLVCNDGTGYEDVFYSNRTDEEIKNALLEGKGVVNDWLDFKDVPPEYENCYCDLDFYVASLKKNIADLKCEEFTHTIEWEY